MKIKQLALTAIAFGGIVGASHAQTVINITGATAFRQAAHQAILDSLDPGYVYAYQGTNIGNAGRAIFSGVNNGNNVIIRTSWSGSVAGIRAIVNQSDSVTYLSTNATMSAAGTSGVSSPTDSTTQNFIAFADNTQDNTPFDAVTLQGGPVGVIAFTAVTNNQTYIQQGNHTTTPGNITTLQLRRLMTVGDAPLQFITGNASHAGKRIYWTGRRDTSGTRVIYLAESGRGASQPVNQWRIEPLNNTTGIPITAIRLWPTGDTTNASTIWGPDTAGNGGYESGGFVANGLQRTSTSVEIKNAGNGTISTGQDIVILSGLSIQDANDVQNGGGKVLAYNGVYIEPESVSTGLSVADKDKIAKGQYTYWSYENLFYRDDIDSVTASFIADLETNTADPVNIGGNGIPVSEMRVSRQADGGSLTVLGSLP